MQPELKPVPNNDSSFGRGAPTWETAQPVASDAQKVLRNTYLLLALSMIPTVLGAVIGVQMNFSFFAGSPFIGFMVFLGIAFGFFYGIEKTKNSPMGVVLLLAFTFFMGLMLSRLLVPVLGLKNGGSLIAYAFGGTSIIFFAMGTLASTIKKDLTGLGKFLFAGVILLLVASVANIFLQIPAMMIAISVIAIAIFSAFILYDVKRILDGGETNYITATLGIYLSVYNVFSNLLSLLGIIGGDRD